MRISKFAAVSAMVIAAMGIGTGAVNAAPAAPQASQYTAVQGQLPGGVGYTVSAVDKSVVLRADAGSLTARGNVFEVRDRTGKVLTSLPLTYQLNGMQWPIAAKVQGRTATLTPITDPVKAVPVKPVAAEDFNSALSQASVEIGLAWAVASVIGTVVGGGIGCVVGAIVGTALMPAIFIAGPIGGCLAGIVAGSALGGVIGNLVLGVPVTIGSAIKFFDTINKPKA
ncbi:MAG: hypothetical protein HOQ24_06185 [Mycobacteriaceae bacterium]|nr:hypothetical protein [Mycobacteriaceae bacterium]